MVHFFFAATFGVALSGLPLVAADDCLANGGTFFKEAELKKSRNNVNVKREPSDSQMPKHEIHAKQTPSNHAVNDTTPSTSTRSRTDEFC